jgi:hypothetical protein
MFSGMDNKRREVMSIRTGIPDYANFEGFHDTTDSNVAVSRFCRIGCSV